MCDNEVLYSLIKEAWDIIAEYLQYNEALTLKRYFRWQLPCKPVIFDHNLEVPFLIDRPNTDLVYIDNYAGYIHSYEVYNYILELINVHTIKKIAIKCHLCDKYNWICVVDINVNPDSKVCHSYLLHVHTLKVVLSTKEGTYKKYNQGLCSCVKNYYQSQITTTSYKKESKIMAKTDLESIIGNHMTWIKLQDGTIKTLLFDFINIFVFTK